MNYKLMQKSLTFQTFHPKYIIKLPNPNQTHMNKLSTSTEPYRQSFLTEANQSESEKQRKSLILQLNPKTQQFFGNVDFDYSELFVGLAVFLDSLKEGPSAQLNQEMKKNFFVKNYERVLIHFFQFLFDFQLETLQFEEKYETIPSFAEWLQNQVTFQLPKQICLLNKKKNQTKRLKEKNISEQIQNNQMKGKSPKRSFDKITSPNQKYQISKIQSPRKIKVIEKQYQFSSFGTYDETTNHTAHYTPKQNYEKNDLFDGKKFSPKSPQQKQVKSKRKILKVKQAPIQKNQSQRITSINKRKQSYTLKPNFKEKIEARRLPSIQKEQSLQIQTNQKSQQKNENGIQVKSTKENSNKKPQIIILQSSGEEKVQQGQKKNELQIISISQCSIIEEIPASVFQERKSNSKQRKKPVGQLISDKYELIQLQSEQKVVPQTIKVKKDNKQPKVQFIKEGSQNFDRLKDLVEDIKISYHLENAHESQLNQYERIYNERQERKLHNFRSRLSGVFRYPEKRFYIFPDMTQWNEKEDNIGNRKSFDSKSTSKGKSLKKENSKEKKTQ